MGDIGAATVLMMLHDGIVVGGSLDGAGTLQRQVREAVTQILDRPGQSSQGSRTSTGSLSAVADPVSTSTHQS